MKINDKVVITSKNVPFVKKGMTGVVRHVHPKHTGAYNVKVMTEKGHITQVIWKSEMRKYGWRDKFKKFLLSLITIDVVEYPYP